MEKAINIFVGIVIVSVACFGCYLIQQANIRQKELDKKRSDTLEQQKEINSLIIEKIKDGSINLMSTDQMKFCQAPSSNGNKKRKSVKLTKEKSN